MTIRISMWSGPRNISTTMMRSFGARADTSALDEPFYGYYLARTGAAHPYRDETLATYPSRYARVIDWMNGDAATPVRFFKHIAYHLAPDDNLDWMADHRAFILIRDPRAMVASFANKYDDVAPIAESYAMARRIAADCARRGAPCPVVDAADILADPPAMMRALCASLEMPFDPAMLAWPAGPRAEDGPWAPHWYDAVNASTGFRQSPPKTISLPDSLETIAAQSLPDYRALAATRLKPA